MGTFPPKAHRWSMDFYYPNPINDFWRIMGLIFRGDKDAFWLPREKRFDLEPIKALLTDKGIAMNDTARVVRRLRDNASDKFLEIVEPVPLEDLLNDLPQCTAVATTGQKAAEVVAQITGTPVSRLGEAVSTQFASRGLDIWRMPSSSRAYPMRLETKADNYRRLFHSLGMI